jgi:hypothetical protein
MYYIRTLAQGSFYVVKFKAQLLPGIVYIVAFAVRFDKMVYRAPCKDLVKYQTRPIVLNDRQAPSKGSLTIASQISL